MGIPGTCFQAYWYTAYPFGQPRVERHMIRTLFAITEETTIIWGTVTVGSELSVPFSSWSYTPQWFPALFMTYKVVSPNQRKGNISQTFSLVFHFQVSRKSKGVTFSQNHCRHMMTLFTKHIFTQIQ